MPRMGWETLRKLHHYGMAGLQEWERAAADRIRTLQSSSSADDDIAAEGANGEHGAPVAVRAPHRLVAQVATTVAIGIPAHRQRHVGVNRAAERARVELEAGITGQGQANGSRVRREIVAASLCERSGNFQIPTQRLCIEALAHDISHS